MKEEVFTVVNKDDQPIGKATRSEVHGNPELIHRVSHVLVFNSNGQLFLQKRGPQKDVQPGKWDTSVGGHVDLGEDYQDAALRETREELGFEPVTIEFLYKYLHSNNFESEYVSTFSCVWDGPIITNQEEISEGRFWTISEIEGRAKEQVFTPNFLDELQRYQHFINDNKQLKK
ncbi:MAG: NUDIX domain-containing protein [Proteobacteria bacterium]|nr:NUDIX domain-containing protein [Pseudomonadota bacterium]